MNNEIFNNINGYALDEQQRSSILNAKKYSLIVAGAGSGKTLTLIGKIKYLMEVKKIKPEEILCISFTNESTKSLQEKLGNKKIDCLTFHKLAIKLLDLNHYDFHICEEAFLRKCIDTFFECFLYPSPLLKKEFKKVYKKLFLSQKKYNEWIKGHKFKTTKKTIETFISLYNTNCLTKQEFMALFTKKNKSILLIIYSILQYYEKEKELQGLLDFDDLIKKAKDIVKKKGKTPFYKEIIIDEYQDTSLLRLHFIKSILDITNANLTVVGDDFQSIYKFSGCDLNLFLHFSDYFPGASIHKIENTYRNSQELINLAGGFVMQHKGQIHKDLKSKKSLEKPVKFIKEKEKRKTLLETILYVYKNYQGTLLILGRNNNDLYSYLQKEEIEVNDSGYFTLKKYPSIPLRYLTAHKSKGLESDQVILINLENKTLGFPSQIEDPSILKGIKKEENFLYAEERRLFYVALTRTKNYVFLLVPRNESIFITEIKKDKVNTEWINIH